MLRLPVIALAAAAFGLFHASSATAGGPGLILGAAEDNVKGETLVATKARLTVFRLAGFAAVRITSNWTPGATAPTADQLRVLQNVAGAGQLAGVRVFVSVYSPGSATTPLTPEAQAQFAQYTAALVRDVPQIDDVIVANEPNLNRFWLPQFGPDGKNASAPAYLTLLAQTYDAIKAVDPGVRVYGGALAPRGSDRPDLQRQTSSPTGFIQALGAAYRASGRTTPIMDAFSMHPYADNSAQSPDFQHPNSTTISLNDYGKLVTLLGQAFDGTAQPGSTLPILYDEFGVESQVPPGRAKAYTGSEPATTKPVPEAQQAAYYQRALQLAFCQPNVIGMLLFHSHDESALPSWQSGVFYADGAPKSSLPFVRDALDRTRGGSVARCEGLQLTVGTASARFPNLTDLRAGRLDPRFSCTLDCVWEASLLKDGTPLVTRRGFARARVTTFARLGTPTLSPGTYRFTITLTHPVNPGTPFVREGRDLLLA